MTALVAAVALTPLILLLWRRALRLWVDWIVKGHEVP